MQVRLNTGRIMVPSFSLKHAEDSLQAAGSRIVDQSTPSQKHDAVQRTPSLEKAAQNPKSSQDTPSASSTTPTPSV